MSGWNYAQLSRSAKENGGPEKLLNNNYKYGFEKGVVWGRLQMLSLTGVTFGLGYLIKYFGDKRHDSTAELEAAKQELINRIKEYDATHNIDDGPENA